MTCTGLGGGRTSGTGPLRIITAVVVVLVHCGFVVAFLYAARWRAGARAERNAVMTFIAVPGVVEPRRQPTARGLARHQHIEAASSTLAAPVDPAALPLAVEPSTSIDWAGSAKLGARAALAPDETVQFGALPHSKSREVDKAESWWPAPLHHAGEQYQVEPGLWVVWLNDSCYLVLDSLAIGSPFADQKGHSARGQCLRRETPAGELFKALPEYKKYHQR